jgi:pimeloyl-ACP methyl ester carboxylesterase
MDTHFTRSTGPALGTETGIAVSDFLDAQQRALDRYGVAAQRRYVDLPTTGGQAQVLVAGDGPPLVMVIGGGIPGVLWAPLMAELPGHTLYAIELPGFGLTDPVGYRHDTVRRAAVDYLAGVVDALALGPTQFVTQSMGSQWTAWLAADQPGRVTLQVMIGCPAFFLDTSAVLPFRLASVPGLGPLLMWLQKPSAANAERVMRMVGESPAGLDELRDVLAMAQRLPTYTPSLLSLMRAVMRWGRPRPAVVTTPDRLGRIDHPVRMVWGERDRFGAPRAGRRIAELIPGADLHVVPGGHAPWFHHAEIVARLTRDFLDTQRGASTGIRPVMTDQLKEWTS